MDQPIRSRVATEEFRRNWEKVFGKQKTPRDKLTREQLDEEIRRRHEECSKTGFHIAG